MFTILFICRYEREGPGWEDLGPPPPPNNAIGDKEGEDEKQQQKEEEAKRKQQQQKKEEEEEEPRKPVDNYEPKLVDIVDEIFEKVDNTESETQTGDRIN